MVFESAVSRATFQQGLKFLSFSSSSFLYLMKQHTFFHSRTILCLVSIYLLLGPLCPSTNFFPPFCVCVGLYVCFLVSLLAADNFEAQNLKIDQTFWASTTHTARGNMFSFKFTAYFQEERENSVFGWTCRVGLCCCSPEKWRWKEQKENPSIWCMCNQSIIYNAMWCRSKMNRSWKLIYGH